MASNQLKPFIEYETNYSHLLIKPGDLIEILRPNYKHWAFCEKVEDFNVWCFHVQVLVRKVDSDNKSAILKYEKLEYILKNNNDSEESLFRVNNQEEMARKLKNENKNSDYFKPLDIKQLSDILEPQKNKSVEYDVKDNNCEHYVTRWKYGMGWSTQVKQTEAVIRGCGIGLGLGLIVTGNPFLGVPVLAIGLAAGGVMNLLKSSSLSQSSSSQVYGFDKANLKKS